MLLSKLIVCSQVPDLSSKRLDPPIIVQEQLQRKVVVPEDDRVKMCQMMSCEVDSHLAVGKLHRLQIVVRDLVVGLDALRFQHEFGIPLPDILVDNQHLKMPVRCTVVERSLGEHFKWDWLLFDDAASIYGYLPIDIQDSWSSHLTILKYRSARRGQGG